MNNPWAISTSELQSGERVGLGVLEVTSIPHISILQDANEPEEKQETAMRLEFAALLSEAYQVYRQELSAGQEAADISLEIIWLAEPVANQPYSAAIRLFILARAIRSRAAAAEAAVSALLEICRTILEIKRYEMTPLDYPAFAAAFARVRAQEIHALIKDERVENLQNQMVPACYTFDVWGVSSQDMGRIANSLIDFPDCAISFQLIPAAYSAAEAQAADRTAQILDTLKKGVVEQGVGSISYTLAEKSAQTYKYYTENKSRPLFSFNILVYGSAAATASLSARILGLISRGGGVHILKLDPAQVKKDANFYPLPWAVGEMIRDLRQQATTPQLARQFGDLLRLPGLITAEEAVEFFRLPVGNSRIGAGFRINESNRGGRTYNSSIINGGDLIAGRLKSSARGDYIGLFLGDLTKHMLITGTPGSGKTTFAIGLLDRLWKEHKIPFLVIEPAKNEYRALVQSIPDLQVFTPGKNHISPFLFNPFVPPAHVRLETYKSTLKTAFAAAVSMASPLDKIFEESVNNCYSDHKWLDTYTTADKGQTFSIAEFIRCFQQTFDAIGYTGDARNIGRAGVVRLNSLASLFDNDTSIPIEDLLKKPTVIELAAVENSDQKALIIALLLLSILAYVNSNNLGDGILKNIILLEEAHVLLDASSNAGPGEADPSAIAQNLLKRMLAEIRAYGVGLIVADQSPRKVTADVVALTDIKMAFRLVEAADKQIIADSTNMQPVQAGRLARLKPGEAFLFFGKLEEPEEIVTANYRQEKHIAISLSDESIRKASTYWNDKQALLRPYPQCRQIKYCAKTCDLRRRALAKEIARRIFVKHFRADSQDPETLRAVFAKISQRVIGELNGEPFDRELLACVKVQLWRRIKYGTMLPVSDQLIANSLEKV